jgi:serine O-acetyltransferase
MLGIWEVLLLDLGATFGSPVPRTTVGRLKLVCRGALTVKGVAVIGFRMAQAAGAHAPLVATLVKQVTHILTGSDIDWHAQIGPGLRLLHPTGIVIAGNARIGARCTLHSGITVGMTPSGGPMIGDDVNLAPGCRIFGPVVVRDDVHVAANAVLTKTIDVEGVVLAGMPARVLRQRRPGGSEPDG